jgi:hypothetical protein
VVSYIIRPLEPVEVGYLHNSSLFENLHKFSTLIPLEHAGALRISTYSAPACSDGGRILKQE